MDKVKLKYWKNRLHNTVDRTTDALNPLFEEIYDFTVHLDPESKKTLDKSLQEVYESMKKLMTVVDDTIEKREREIRN